MVNECPACGFDANLRVEPAGELYLRTNFPSQNQLGANGKGTAGWHYRRLRQEFAAALHSALGGTDIAKATGKRRVWLRRIYRPGKRDYDRANLVGGGKAIVDVLVSRGLVKDDSPSWFEGIYSQALGEHDAIHLRFEDVVDTVTVGGTTP